jgi:surface protein
MSSQSSIQAWKPFEMVVDTTIAGSSGVGNLKLPLRNTKSYRYKVEWGDGITSASTTTTNLTHTYPSGGTYTVKVSGRFDQFYFNGDADTDKILEVVSFGNIVWKTFDSAFEGSDFTGMTTTPPIMEKISGGLDFNQTFRQCTNLDSDFGNWDMSNVTFFGSMFQSASNFNNGGSPSISGWTMDNASVTSYMFSGCAIFNQPIGYWNVSGITNMTQMFYQTASFDQDLSSWDVSNVISLDNIFNDSNFNNGGSPNISGWTFNSGLTSMVGMFADDVPFDQDLSAWDLSNITNTDSMFRGATSFNNSGSTGISGWTTSAVTNMSGMFYNADSFNQDIGNWDVSNVTKFGTLYNGIFEGCAAFDQDLSNWDVSNVTDFSFMFRNTGSFNNGGSPDISGWTFNTGVTSFSNMFRNADSFTQPIGEWVLSGIQTNFGFLDTFREKDFSSGPDLTNLLDAARGPYNVTSFPKTFRQSTNFNQDLSNWDVSSVTYFGDMFYNCTSFDTSISDWDVSNGGDFRYMFNSAGYNQPLSGWTMSAATNLERMFNNNGVFNQDISMWDVSNVQNFSSMFGANGPFDQDLSSWDVKSATNMSQMFHGYFGLISFNQDLGSWNVSGVTNMTNMLTNTSLSTDNYNSILTGWTGWVGTGATKTLQSNVTFGAGGLTYSSGTTAELARNYLTDVTTGLSWTITDGGAV